MVELTEPIITPKQLNQVGMNAMLWLLVKDAGGELSFPAGSLLLPRGAMFDVVHNTETDTFHIKAVVIEPKTIIEPVKRLIL